ncbi:hypothetical protein AGMMS4957_22390 [Bacteroidia bacterium]|nr:hypothetical protein AGMMS4957_22390 [Bacteroidia bacterium]
MCSSREIAYEFYKNVIALRPERKLEQIKMIMTRGKDDDETLYNLLGSKEYRNTI